LEDLYGDIKEPRFLIQWLFGLWIFMGVLVFKRDIWNYYKRLKKQKDDIDYTKPFNYYIK